MSGPFDSNTRVIGFWPRRLLLLLLLLLFRLRIRLLFCPFLISFLYSTPEVTSLELSWFIVVDYGPVVFAWSGARATRTEAQHRSTPNRFLPYVAVNKDAFPNGKRAPAASNHSAYEHRFLA